MIPLTPHPELIALARASAAPYMAAHAAAHGLSPERYALTVRRHLHRTLSGCAVYVRVMEDRLEALLEYGRLPVLGDGPADPVSLERRRRNEAALFNPPTEMTYGFLAEKPDWAHTARLYGSIVLELGRPEGAYWLHGDSGGMFGCGRWRAPSAVQFPHELSWDWAGSGCPLTALELGRVYALPEYLEVQLPERVTWDHVQAVHFDSETQGLDFWRRVQARGVSVTIHSPAPFCRPVDCDYWRGGA